MVVVVVVVLLLLLLSFVGRRWLQQEQDQRGVGRE